MEIWSHTMVKNDGKWLWYAVNSVINYVDKVLLWDTGSTDESLLIEKDLKNKYPAKIILKNRPQNTPEEFTLVRQEMLNETKSDWFLMLDGDEIWWNDSIAKVITSIKSITNKLEDKTEAVVVPTINLVGDIFHYQDISLGNYTFGSLKGHYNLRAIKRNIPGLKSLGSHGVWGWADENGKMIQDRNSFKFINTPYLHATNLIRSKNDKNVVKRSKKFKYEFGIGFSSDYFYPEVFFVDRPEFVQSPWKSVQIDYKFHALLETPLRKIKRKIFKSRVGY